MSAKLLKVFLHPPPPLGRESFVRIVEITVSKTAVLSIGKIDLGKLSFYGLSLEIWYKERNTRLGDFRKEELRKELFSTNVQPCLDIRVQDYHKKHSIFGRPVIRGSLLLVAHLASDSNSPI